MIRNLHLVLAAILLFNIYSFGQNDTTNVDTTAFMLAEGKLPMQDVWASTMLIDAQNSFIGAKGSFEVIIQHRFANLENGIHDLFGLYGASNIRLALHYSILDRLMVGFATEKDKKYQELFVKGNILQQNRSGSMPVSLTFFGNAALSAREKAYYGNNYKFIDRLSYFAQLTVARKFHRLFSMQAGINYSHFNTVEGVKIVDTIINASDSAHSIIRTSYEPMYQNDVLGVTAGARINFYKGMSILLEYDQGFFLKKATDLQLKPKPNLGLAFEVSTSTHCFQVFASSYRGLIPQQNLALNQFDFKKTKGLMIGFNITVRLN